MELREVEGQKNTLWQVYLPIAKEKATGLLTLESPQGKRQIAFRAGEPILVRSGIPQDSFANFLLKSKIIAQDKLKESVKKWENLKPRPDLRVHLVQDGVLSGQDMHLTMTKYFEYRLFEPFWTFYGNVHFKILNQDQVPEAEPDRIDIPFLQRFWQLLWTEPRDPAISSYLREKMGQPYRIRVSEFPIPLPPAQFRIWNQIPKSGANLMARDQEARFIAVLTAMSLIEWNHEDRNKFDTSEAVDIKELEKELKLLESALEKKKAHELLGVGIEDSTDRCKGRYHDLIRRYHPDLIPVEMTALKKIAEKVFAAINIAYSTLTEPSKRAEYLAQIEVDRLGGMEALQKRVEAEMQIPQAQQLIRRRSYKQALELLQEIHKVLSDDGEVLADLVFCEMMWMAETKQSVRSHIKRFQESLERSVILKRDYAPAHYYRGILFKLDNQLEKALRGFDDAIQLDPNMAEAQSEARILRKRLNKDK